MAAKLKLVLSAILLVILVAMVQVQAGGNPEGACCKIGNGDCTPGLTCEACEGGAPTCQIGTANGATCLVSCFIKHAPGVIG